MSKVCINCNKEIEQELEECLPPDGGTIYYHTFVSACSLCGSVRHVDDCCPLAPLAVMAEEPLVHYWQRFIPSMNWILTQCGALVPYDNPDNIVHWAEKPATCPICVFGP